MINPIVLSGSYSEQMDTVCAASGGILYQQRGMILVRIRDNQIDELTATSLQSHLIDHMTPVTQKLTKDGDVIEVPQKKFERDLCQHLIDRTQIDLQELEYVYRCPVFDEDMVVYSEHGYHPTCKAWLNTKDLGFIEPMPIPEAKALLDDLLCDFPFADEASRTNAMMALITPFIRPAVGLMPLFLITAPSEGSGKTLLAEIVGMISDGVHAKKFIAPSDDDEWRKRISSGLAESPSIIIIDNVEDLDAPSLAAALTSKIWTDRILGSTKNMSVPNRAVWFATGNNPTVSAEMSRRCVPIRLVPATEWAADRPFKHSDIERYVIENRTQLVRAAMSLVYHWVMAGKPLVDVTMGSYQVWATIAASVICSHGYTGALDNRASLRTDEDDELRAFIEIWAKNPVARKCATARDLESMCRDDDGDWLASVRGNSLHTGARSRRVSAYIAGKVDRIYGCWKICRSQDSHSKAVTFYLESLK